MHVDLGACVTINFDACLRCTHDIDSFVCQRQCAHRFHLYCGSFCMDAAKISVLQKSNQESLHGCQAVKSSNVWLACSKANAMVSRGLVIALRLHVATLPLHLSASEGARLVHLTALLEQFRAQGGKMGPY